MLVRNQTALKNQLHAFLHQQYGDTYKQSFKTCFTENALEIAKQCGTLYDKFVGFVDDLEKLGQRLDQAQTQQLVKDMNRRYALVEASTEEFKTLERSSFYLKSVRQLGFILRRAKYVRLANQLAFGQAVANFYTVYGNILRYLKIDQARGHLQPV